jgi:hypothetical protein
MSKRTNTPIQPRILVTNLSKVRGHGFILVAWARKILRETSAREADRHLRVHLSRATDSRDEGALQATIK